MSIVAAKAVDRSCMCLSTWKGEKKKRKERTTPPPTPLELTLLQMAHLHVKVQRKQEAICRPLRRAGVRSLFTRPCRLRLQPPTPRCVGWHRSPTHFPAVSLFHNGTHNGYIKQLSNTALSVIVFISICSLTQNFASKRSNNYIKVLRKREKRKCIFKWFKCTILAILSVKLSRAECQKDKGPTED